MLRSAAAVAVLLVCARPSWCTQSGQETIAHPIKRLSSVTADVFFSRYLRAGEPVIVENAAAAWDAMRWTLPELATR